MNLKRLTMKIYFFILSLSLLTSTLAAQSIAPSNLTASKVSMSETRLDGRNATKVVVDTSIKGFDEPTFARLNNVDFHNGTIEVNVYSKFITGAPDWARGFIGIAFRINSDNSKFECFYIRPDNGRANDQVRRNHATQYFSYPDHRYDDFRKSDPGKYESYADMGMVEWIKMKIVVKDDHAQLFINNSKEPSLIVTDLKHGANMAGSVGLWVGNWTEGYFSDLRISK